MKRKLLLSLAVAIFTTLGAWAQTDVTSTHLTNADFESSTPIDSDLHGYTDGGTPAHFQDVDGWDFVVLAVNANSADSNGGMAGGVLAYGSEHQLKGNSKAIPATNPNGGSTGNALGFFAVWAAGGYYYQDVNLPAGKYTLTFPIYNASGTQANDTYTGFFPTEGTNQTVAINTTVGEWVNQTVTFTLAAATPGQIRIGYKSTGDGSNANPMLFYDGVKIEYTEVVVKDVLGNAITAATAVNASLSDGGLTAAIATAQDVFDNASATQAQVNAAVATLNAAVEAAMSAAGDATFLVVNPGFEASSVTTTNAAAGASAAPLNIEGSWEQTSSAAWCSSAVVEYGGEGQVNGVKAPEADNAENTGKTLGVSVGWGGTVAYRSAAANFPAGVYTVKVYGYNALEGVTQFKSQFGFVPTVGDATLSTKTAFAYGEWEEDVVKVVLNEATEGRIQVGGTAISGGSGSNAKVFFDNITVNYQSFLDAAKADWAEAKAAAEAAVADEAYANVTGDEKTTLTAAIAATEPATKEAYDAATAALASATAVFKAAKAAYDGLASINAVATAVGLEAAAATTAAAAAAATQTQNVAVYNKLDDVYPYTVELGDWTKTGASQNNKGQHWNGDATATYFEPNQWGAASVDWQLNQGRVLPAGQYLLMATGRRSADLTLSMSVIDGEEVLGTVSDFPALADGKGVDLNGDANFADADDTYSNSNNGHGWQWRYIPFTVAEETTATLNVTATAPSTHQWASITEFRLLSVNRVNYHQLKLKQTVADAKAVDVVTNVGTKPFQIPAAAATALTTAIAEAETVATDDAATDGEYDAAKTDLDAAVAAYKGAELNTPSDGQLFCLILRANGWGYNSKAVTYVAGGREDAGLYAVDYVAYQNQNLAQAFTFTHVSDNNYKLSQIDNDGNVRYLCTGTVYSGNNNQIRTTTEAENAALFTVIPSATQNIYNLKNVAANQFIGSQDQGFYTVNSHIDFTIRETARPIVEVNTTEAGWGTLMLPFALDELPEGVKAYSCAEIGENDELTLVEVSALEANTPYIIEGEWEEDLEGDALGAKETYTTGLLTGVYVNYDAPVGSYVLQQQDDKLAFFVVAEDKQPLVPECHAYLTAPAGSEVKVLTLGGVETAIRSLTTSEAADSAVYNLAGQRVGKTVRGIYVVNGKKVVK